MNKLIVSAEWLNENLNNEDLIILDASPKKTIMGDISEYANKRIPKARIFDVDNEFSDNKSPFPHTLPNKDDFEKECRKLGINKSSKIVVYDNLGIYVSPRVWWMFKVMGHDDIAVLDGGILEWVKKDYLLEEKKAETYEAGDFEAVFHPEFVKSYQDILDNIEKSSFLVVDARSRGRFNGTEPEPREHLKSGSIPNSVNIPYSEVLENDKFKSPQELKEIFEKECGNCDNLVFSCGSGLTACIVMMASEIGFKSSKKIFDGAWTEWAERQNLKV